MGKRMASSSSSDSSAPQTPQLRKDSVTNRWVIFSPARAKRPSDFKSKSPVNPNQQHQQQCPFCIGHEHECAPEIFRVPPDNPDWKLRVIQNLYPALSRDIPAAEEGNNSDSGRVVVNGFGFHDVVIETPVHSVQLSDLSPREIGEVLVTYTRRIKQLMSYDSIKYVQVFKNHGASAGASMSHSHSQIMALPVVPPAVATRLGMSVGLIDVSAHFISIVPFAATFPFEMWIIPLDHSSHFHELDSEKAVELGGILKLVLRKMSLQLNNPPFNFMVQTSPLGDNASQLLYSHWFMQIVPQLSVVAGFEMGTGCYINPVFPEDAAKVLREGSSRYDQTH
ncbi:UTP:galactose-1-phosphate uridylyltransferase [Prunus dulcis]|uniref:UTP:galactose-1-phosphate uridylyltransferase n=1 Tax=Prunus dulcis TaxID=3755 RepID=A0A4Y1RSX9_PRUDU|nr:UTP:galactose-1-phosphate uridylyltransferase [Prunus dulcis]